MKTLLLVRHGTTEWVERHILHGITDIPLNDNGLRQAREVAEVLKSVPASHLYSSPLTRCMQTAQAIAARLNLEPVPLDGLIEMNFGWLEGKPFKDPSTLKLKPLVRFIDQLSHRLIRTLSGELISQFKQRIMVDWDRILTENHDNTVIVVGHSAVFNTILIHYFGKNFPKGHTYYSMAPGSINEIIINDQGNAKLLRFNDRSHLSQEGS